MLQSAPEKFRLLERPGSFHAVQLFRYCKKKKNKTTKCGSGLRSGCIERKCFQGKSNKISFQEASTCVDYGVNEFFPSVYSSHAYQIKVNRSLKV